MYPSENILGEKLEPCCKNPVTGFYRNGCCDTGREDVGAHVVCAVVDEAFLTFSKAQGNDLSTPRPEFGFRGLKPGDRWCLCASRWKDALDADQAPPVVLAATHTAALRFVTMRDLLKHAWEPEDDVSEPSPI